jgi:dUTPase
VTVNAGDRIAQGVILPFVRAEWQEEETAASATSRGGFGSTG